MYGDAAVFEVVLDDAFDENAVGAVHDDEIPFAYVEARGCPQFAFYLTAKQLVAFEQTLFRAVVHAVAAYLETEVVAFGFMVYDEGYGGQFFDVFGIGVARKVAGIGVLLHEGYIHYGHEAERCGARIAGKHLSFACEQPLFGNVTTDHNLVDNAFPYCPLTIIYFAYIGFVDPYLLGKLVVV